MYITVLPKSDLQGKWHLPDRIFFACGACHVLAYAFLAKHGTANSHPVWLKPSDGYIGNHVFVRGPDYVFDYHGYSDPDRFLAHTYRKARRWWPGWDASLVELPVDALISEAKSKTFDGLWLREPEQFWHDALPRAAAFVDRFQTPIGR